MLAMTAMPPVVLLVAAYFFLQESPHWLIANGRSAEAQDVVRAMIWWQSGHMCFANKAEVEDLEECLRLPPKLDVITLPSTLNDGSKDARIFDTNDSAATQESQATKSTLDWLMSFLGVDVWRVRMIFGKHFFSTTVIMCYVCFASNFAYYGMIYGLPSSLKTEAEHAEAQAEALAKETGEKVTGMEDQWTPAGGVFMSALFEIPGVFIAIVLAVTIGRRLNMGLAFFGCGACCSCVVYGLMTDQFETWSIGAIFGVKLFIALGFIIVYLYLLEVYPTTIRGTGLAVCMVVGRLGAFLCPFMYDGMVLAGVHHSWFFVFMAVILYIASVVVFFLPYETKDAMLLEDLPAEGGRMSFLRSNSIQRDSSKA